MNMATLSIAQSIEELNQIKSSYQNAQNEEFRNRFDTGQNSIIDQEAGLPRRATITPYFPDIIVRDELEYFGYDFFTRRDTVAFWENLPTLSNYLLGPGDELVISLWGETQLREIKTINREGKIYDEKVGLLNLAGKTMPEVETYLKEQFGRIYSTLKGKNPSTFFDVSLGDLRSINVNFVGKVNYPGVFPVHPFSTVITGLVQAGGVSKIGSLRNIEIKRDGALYSTVDLYDYFLKGEVPEKIQLRDQDIIIVPVNKLSVTIDSAVVKPGIYEGVPGETIYDLIQYAGGLKVNSASTIGLERIIPLNKRNNGNTYENFYLELEKSKLIEIQNGDHISIHKIFQEQELVQLIGQVKNPGIYKYYDGMSLDYLLELGGGFQDSTFVKSIYMEQAEIIRRNPNSRYEKIIGLNLNDIIEFQKGEDIILQNLDRIVIHANFNYFERKNIKITGEVNIPGSYPLLNDSESLLSIIDRAGGLSSKALENGVSIYRDKIYFETPPKDKVLSQLQAQTIVGSIEPEIENDKIRLAWEGFGVNLMPGDSIVVKEKVGAVYVTGEVYNSGLVEYQRGKSIRYYINSAGGINNYGNRDNVIVVYPNGITSPWRRFRSTIITDGSTIIVYQKADLSPFDFTVFATNTASLLTSFVTILVLTQQLNTN